MHNIIDKSLGWLLSGHCSQACHHHRRTRHGGKTSTVVKILDILLEESPDLAIKLVAPTGKAAMRLAESISEWADTRETKIQVQTLHRLLGMRKDGRTGAMALKTRSRSTC